MLMLFFFFFRKKVANNSVFTIHCQIFKWVPLSFLFPTLRVKRLFSICLLLINNSVLLDHHSSFVKCWAYMDSRLHSYIIPSYNVLQIQLNVKDCDWKVTSRQGLFNEMQKQYGIWQTILPPSLVLSVNRSFYPRDLDSLSWG